MEIVYRPAEGEEKAFPIDPEDLDLEELGILENYTGKTYEEITAALGGGRGVFGVLRPLLYIYLRRENPEIHYRDVKPKFRQVQLRPSLDELLDLQKKVLADPKYPNRAQLLAELKDDIAEARARGASGKADSGPTPPPSSTGPSRRRGKATATSST